MESGLLQPVREWCDPGELVREAVAASGLKEKDVRINIAKDLPAVSVDSGLIQQALDALLSNAMIYGKSDQPIEVSVARDDSTLVISVADRGAGLAPGEEEQSVSKILSRSARRGPADSGLVFPLPGSWSKRTAVRSSPKIEKTAARDFSIRLPHRRTNAIA